MGPVTLIYAQYDGPIHLIIYVVTFRMMGPSLQLYISLRIKHMSPFSLIYAQIDGPVHSIIYCVTVGAHGPSRTYLRSV